MSWTDALETTFIHNKIITVYDKWEWVEVDTAFYRFCCEYTLCTLNDPFPKGQCHGFAILSVNFVG